MSDPNQVPGPIDPPSGGTPRGWLVWAAVGVVVLLLGGVAFFATRDDDESTSVDASDQTEQAGEGEVDRGDDDEAGDDTMGSDTFGTIPSDPGSSAAALPEYDAYDDVDPAAGETIPTYVGADADGNEITIEPDGTAKVILFVAHWCPHCQDEVPVLVDHLNDNPMPSDVELITVSTAVKPGAENYPAAEWLADEGWAAPVIEDDDVGTAGRLFGLSAFPFFVVVDADGKVVMRGSGEATGEEFAAMVEAAQTGEPSD